MIDGISKKATKRENPSRDSFPTLNPLSPQNLPPLPHHVRKQNPTSRHIDSQHSPKSQRLPPACHHTGLPNQRTLTHNAHRIKHKEGIISQPRDKGWHTAPLEGEDEVAVAYDLCDRPSKEHGAVKNGGRSSSRVTVDDGPDEEEAGGDLHAGCEDGRADDTCAIDTVQQSL